MLSLADTKIEQLHQQVEALAKEKETFEEKVSRMPKFYYLLIQNERSGHLRNRYKLEKERL